MTFLKLIRYALIVAIVFLVAAAGYISYLVVKRQASLEQVSRYNTTWNVSQAVQELMRLEHRMAAFGLKDGAVDQDEVQLRFDILSNRLPLLQDGDIDAFLDLDPERRATVGAFRKGLSEVEPLLERLRQPGVLKQALAILAPLDARMVGLAAAANSYGGNLVAADQQELIHLHWYFSLVSAGLIVCGFSLIGFLVKQNQVLRTQEADLRTQNMRFDTALNNMSRGLCMFDSEQRLIVSNDLFLSKFAFSPEIVKPGITLDGILAHSETAGEQAMAGVKLLFGQQKTLIEEHTPGLFEQELDDGRILAVHHQPMGTGGWVATYEDISERRRAEARIAHMARHDSLTQLPNRLLFRERMEQALAGAQRHGHQPAVVYLDLDQFKNVNDTLGHPVGDRLLRLVAQRLAGCIRDTDTVARLGGDEFAIIHLAPTQPQHAALLAQRVVEVLGAPYDIDGNEINIGASVGIAVGPGDGRDPDELLRNADLALYRAKSEGGNTFRFFEPQMDAQVQARRQLELDLRHALVNGEFELHYQPLIDLKSNTTCGFEALLRWMHPQRGSVPPSVFIPVAEEIGLIQAIGEWVLRRACAAAAGWPQELSIAVNLSPIQFKSRKLVEVVLSALATSRLAANRLELEITESVVLEDSETTLTTLRRLHQLGIHIALDDFGTGYSSLSCLRTFPFDKVKIDQSFVREMTERGDCAAIVRAVVALAADLGIATTAEGVETAEQLERLRAEGCSQAQGFHFSHALPEWELARWLQAERAAVIHAA